MSDHSGDLDKVLGTETRASEWRALRKALVERLKNLRSSRDLTPDPDVQISLARQIETLEAQIETLRIEEAVAQFGEDSIRFTIATSHLEDEQE